MNKTTIFKQLVISILIPVTLVLIILGSLNYYNTNSLLKEACTKRNKIISDEIQNVLSVQDYTLRIIESQLDVRVESISNKLVKKYFSDSKKCVSENLLKIRNELGMDSLKEDIYIIDASTGYIVNTTYKKDKDINVYEFGNDFKRFLNKVIQEKKFVRERFSIETSTNKIKKYTYQPTLDGKYIIETGIYSSEADSTMKNIDNLFQRIKIQDPSIYQIDLFIGSENPFSFNTGRQLSESDIQRPALLEAFKTKKNVTYEVQNDDYGKLYDFIFMERKNTTLYKSSVIMVVTDKTNDTLLLRNELVKHILLFGLTVVIIIVIIYLITRKIVMPVKRLLDNVVRISAGNFSERAIVEGNNEITVFSEKFNEMLSTIENYYTQLEDKVQKRTEEVLNQKNQYKILQQLNQEILIRNEEIKTQQEEIITQHNYVVAQKQEIEIQKAEITDSIIYAQRIQKASFPMQVFLDFIFPKHFILFEPKDIVSGDFYWAYKIEKYTLFAVGDCTGHGVPGSFLTILGISFLNEIAASLSVPDPAIMLDRLRLKIIKSLHQTDKNNILSEGMDIALCVINENTQDLAFAGAISPVYVLRQEQEESVDSNKTSFLELKGDKMPIGSFMLHNKPFVKRTMQLKEKDMIYIFSDGIKDQIGGPNSKRYKISQFKNFLSQIYMLPVNEQRDKIQSTIKTWRSNNENDNLNYGQTDDICIMGVKYTFEKVEPHKIFNRDYEWEL